MKKQINNFYSCINRIMKNRYQDDDLYYFMFKSFLIILFINVFIKNEILNIINILLALIILYRYFSKNIERRRKENKTFVKFKNKLINKINEEKKYLFDKNNVYKKCNKCKTIIKLPLPSKRGFKTVICPECNKKHRFLVLKKQKIEIIKKRK